MCVLHLQFKMYSVKVLKRPQTTFYVTSCCNQKHFRGVSFFGISQKGSKKDDNSNKPVRIGCASGFWGDTPTAVPQLVRKGKIDFLVFDYLAEITMSLLAGARRKNPNLGYAPDFVMFAMSPFLKEIKEQGIKVISNAGGLNPAGCCAALQEAAKKAGVKLKIATVHGDDLMPCRDEVQKVIEGEQQLTLPKNVVTMNAYLGAGPIAAALDLGADVVITGRCVDSAVVLGPLLHQFKWKLDDWDKLAAGSLAGHLLECGAQSTGGIFTDWEKVTNWEDNGFPIAECSPNGDFYITKPEGTGGLVNWGTVAEQMLYEVDDPSNYILPDVVCDFSKTSLKEIAGGVLVKGAKGRPPTSTYKVSATYADGFRTTAVCPVIGPKAADKARKTASAILKRCEALFKALNFAGFTKTNIEVIGAGTNYGPRAKAEEKASREVALWLAVHHASDRALELFAREIASAATGMAPGLTTLVGGRPRVSPVLKLFSCFYPKDKLNIDIAVDGKKVSSYNVPFVFSSSKIGEPSSESEPTLPSLQEGSNDVRLESLAYTRSGDKGNTANIAVIARHPAFLPYIREALTEEAVATYFEHLFENKSMAQRNVRRYDCAGIHAINFVLTDVLGGGGVASLRTDPQGKALGQMLLDFEIGNMPDLDRLVSKHKSKRTVTERYTLP